MLINRELPLVAGDPSREEVEIDLEELMLGVRSLSAIASIKRIDQRLLRV